MARRRPDADGIICARLSGIARRHAAKGTPEAEAVAELREVAKGRADLLGREAGIALGVVQANQLSSSSWTAQREADRP